MARNSKFCNVQFDEALEQIRYADQLGFDTV
jgi:hypothetical protein